MWRELAVNSVFACLHLFLIKRNVLVQDSHGILEWCPWCRWLQHHLEVGRRLKRRTWPSCSWRTSSPRPLTHPLLTKIFFLNKVNHQGTDELQINYWISTTLLLTLVKFLFKCASIQAFSSNKVKAVQFNLALLFFLCIQLLNIFTIK